MILETLVIHEDGAQTLEAREYPDPIFETPEQDETPEENGAPDSGADGEPKKYGDENAPGTDVPDAE